MGEQEQRRAEAQVWFEKADRDLVAAQTLASGDNPLFDYAVFHCQQAAEKAIKALLVYHGQEFDNKHSLRYLIKLAKPFEPTVDSYIDARDRLTRYAVDPRYPHFGFGTYEQFEEALQSAKDFCMFILSVLPSEVRPPERGNE